MVPFENRFNPDGLADEIYDYVTSTMTGVPDALKKEIRDCFRPTNHAHIALAQFVELGYARRAELPVPALDLVAQAAETAGAARLAGLDGDNRGSRIAVAVRKNASVPTPPASTATGDPEVSPAFAQPAP